MMILGKDCAGAPAGTLRPREAFEPGSPDREGKPFSLAQIDWQSFDQYLEKSFYLKTRQDYRRYAQRFVNVLANGDASPLLGMSHDRRRHVMSSLSALSNFLGQKDTWKAIIARYGLHWADRTNNLDDIAEMIYTDRFTEMIDELKKGFTLVPQRFSNYLKFDALTGLRPAEAIQSCNMLRNNGHGYFNSELQLLEHFKFPALFLRGKKRAYFSIVDDEILQIAQETASVSYKTLRVQYRRYGLRFRMAFGRKVFGTWARRYVHPEIVDLIEGRTPGSTFAKHYYRPDFRAELEKIRTALPELRKLLE
jgi:hypothetical protein